ncbi:MAG: AAA family ATPase [Pseudomonadota bacterium]
MNETLYIENFLVIKKAELQLNRINLLIGPQSSGKSLIAKLCHFFKNTQDQLMSSLFLEKEEDLKKTMMNDFCNKFPDYTWKNDDFLIRFHDARASVFLRKKENSCLVIEIDFREKLEDETKSELRKIRNKISGSFGAGLKTQLAMMDRLEPLYRHIFPSVLFVPAARSFLANLQNNIFFFMTRDIDIDPFMRSFGYFYEMSKSKYKNNGYEEKSMKNLMMLMSDVVNGSYQFSDNQDWIVQKNRKVNLAQASSGQQEILPLLLTSAIYVIDNQQKSDFIFIEEPEAHLFPEAQSKVMAFFSYLYAEYQTSFFLTSHSPYILSALNNHILAAEVVEAGNMAPERFTELNGYGVPIPFSDVAAYTICDGEVKSIRDEEYQMIGGEMLDGISDHFGRVTDALLELHG